VEHEAGEISMTTISSVSVTRGKTFDIAAPLYAFFTQVVYGGAADGFDGGHSDHAAAQSRDAQIVSSIRTAESGTGGCSPTTAGEAP
jgi:hypothetical protein